MWLVRFGNERHLGVLSVGGKGGLTLSALRPRRKTVKWLYEDSLELSAFEQGGTVIVPTMQFKIGGAEGSAVF